MNSFIYFIQAHGDGPIKIGFTADDPRKRMVKIQSDCPWPVELIGAVEGTISQEKQIHLVLSRFRTQGEWFEPTAVVLAAIGEAIRCGKSLEIRPKRRGPKYDHPICHYRAENNLTLRQVAALVGLDYVTISRFERRTHKPSPATARKIYKAIGIPPKLLLPELYATIFPERAAAERAAQ